MALFPIRLDRVVERCQAHLVSCLGAGAVVRRLGASGVGDSYGGFLGPTLGWQKQDGFSMLAEGEEGGPGSGGM